MGVARAPDQSNGKPQGVTYTPQTVEPKSQTRVTSTSAYSQSHPVQYSRLDLS